MVIVVDKGKSILDRLRQKARSSGKSFQLVLQLFSQEEFLRQIYNSPYRDNFILKGGLLLYCLSGFEGRPTMDIDFLIRNISNEANNIERIFREITSEKSENEFITFEIKNITPIAEHRDYHGISIKMVSIIKNTKTPFNIDMGVGDVVVPKPQVRLLPTQLNDFKKPEIMTYSLESIVAEKFDAIISRMELTSRMKDYYDIFYLATTYDFEGRKLQEAVFETLQNRRTVYEADSLEKVNGFNTDPEMLKKWKHFIKGTLKQEIEFKQVLEIINKFLGPVFEAIVNEDELFDTWNPNKWGYE